MMATMAQTVFPHYDHHLREVYRTRRRFRIGIALLFVGLFALTGLRFRGANAAEYYTVSGRVYNGTTGAGIGNVRLFLCTQGGTHAYVVTNTNGLWSSSQPAHARVCLRYSSGAPVSVKGPIAVSNQPEHARSSTYEDQVIGDDCYHRIPMDICRAGDTTWDRDVDTGYDFEFMDANSETSTKPASVSRHSFKIATASTHQSWMAKLGVPVALADSADTSPPSTPGSFQATIADGNAVVNLVWDASTDSGGLKGYVLERSLDQLSWEKLSDNIVGTNFSDKTAGFGIHYYYRLSAVDESGNTSGFATADVNTANFTANAVGEDATTYTSDDSFATVSVPPGAVSTDADCGVSVTNIAGDTNRPGNSQGLTLVVGPYYLLCKTSSGMVFTDYAKPLTWVFNLKGKLKDLKDPRGYTYAANGSGNLINGSKYDSVSDTVRVDSTSPNPIMVLAVAQVGVSINLVLGLILVVGIVIALAVLILRKKQKSTYDDYLRDKYYNL
jgi:hypothetical protein